MERFVKIVSCIMARDQEKYCLKNIKMLEKVYFWSMYWSISPGIPSTNILRFDKILFDTVKT